LYYLNLGHCECQHKKALDYEELFSLE